MSRHIRTSVKGAAAVVVATACSGLMAGTAGAAGATSFASAAADVDGALATPRITLSAQPIFAVLPILELPGLSSFLASSATVSARESAQEGAEVTFRLYEPGDLACADPVFTSVKPIAAGTDKVTSDRYVPR